MSNETRTTAVWRSLGFCLALSLLLPIAWLIHLGCEAQIQVAPSEIGATLWFALKLVGCSVVGAAGLMGPAGVVAILHATVYPDE